MNGYSLSELSGWPKTRPQKNDLHLTKVNAWWKNERSAHRKIQTCTQSIVADASRVQRTAPGSTVSIFISYLWMHVRVWDPLGLGSCAPVYQTDLQSGWSWRYFQPGETPAPGYSWRLGNPMTWREERCGTKISEGIKADFTNPLHGYYLLEQECFYTDTDWLIYRGILLGGSRITKDRNSYF